MEIVDSKKLADYVHMQVHALRLLSDYKPSQFEIKISALTRKCYSSSCDECRIVQEHIDKNPISTEKKGFFSKVKGMIE